ncbi:hypothetical protein [Bosea sp. Root483D1]|uniref:hypothetical protein n=1 Tax=Bosea sp. Root483D1 TaxID=1736544 RepID=UPI000A5F76E7|nr:hypothetical protein [Bosea sp. Root483D1]
MLRPSDRALGRDGLVNDGLIGLGSFEGCLLGTACWTINREDPVDAGFLVA